MTESGRDASAPGRGAARVGTLALRDAAHVWHPYTQMRTRPAPIAIVRGEGVYLYTEDGRRLLDGTSSWWVNIHGHSHPVLNEALAKQARELEHVIFANCTHRPGVELAERLVDVLPDGLTRVFYSDNGSTAVEVAVKMASQYWTNRGETRTTFITMHHAYHGDTVGAMSASEASLFTAPFAPMLFDVARAHAPYCYRCPLDLERATCGIACLGQSAGVARAADSPSRSTVGNGVVTHAGAGASVTAGGDNASGNAGASASRAETLGALLERHAGKVAAVIVEPMLQGAGGMIVWPAEFLAGVRRLCDEHGVLMIADEVLTGFGRTGTMFACNHADTSPDIICLSKAVTGGYMPLGVTVTTEEVYDAFLSDDRARAFFHGHSFTGNPLACALALASLQLIHDTNAIEKVRRLETWLHRGLAPLASHPNVGDVRVIGGVGIVELVADKQSKLAGGYLDDVGPRLTQAFLDRDLLLRPLGNIVYAMPPYVITEAETEWLTTQIGAVIGSVLPA